MTGILFFHGFATSPIIWDLQIKEFSKEITIYTSPEEVDPDDDLIIVGWSLGGISAIDYYFSHKEKTKGLVLVSAFPKFLNGDNYQSGLSPILLRNLEKKLDINIGHGITFFYDLIFSDKNYLSSLVGIKRPGRTELFADLERLKSTDIRSKLKQIQVPTLLIHGEVDRIVPVKAAEYMAENIPRSELYIFDGVGHAPFIERAKYFNLRLRNFIKKHG